jgi:hypothetical protein
MALLLQELNLFIKLKKDEQGNKGEKAFNPLG